jgi:hypothetical protein
MSIAEGVGMNFPSDWSAKHDDRLRFTNDALDLRVSVSVYSIPADNQPQLDDVFAGLHGSWKPYYQEAGPVESGPDYRWVRMDTDEDILHLMSLVLRQIGQVYYAVYVMFTFGEVKVFEEEKDTFRRVLTSLGPLA